jgi:hypothetical protein
LFETPPSSAHAVGDKRFEVFVFTFDAVVECLCTSALKVAASAAADEEGVAGVEVDLAVK